MWKAIYSLVFEITLKSWTLNNLCVGSKLCFLTTLSVCVCVCVCARACLDLLCHAHLELCVLRASSGCNGSLNGTALQSENLHLPFLAVRSVYLIGVYFCHYCRQVIIPAEQMLQLLMSSWDPFMRLKLTPETCCWYSSLRPHPPPFLKDQGSTLIGGPVCVCACVQCMQVCVLPLQHPSVWILFDICSVSPSLREPLYIKEPPSHAISYGTLCEGAHFQFSDMSILATCQYACPFSRCPVVRPGEDVFRASNLVF